MCTGERKPRTHTVFAMLFRICLEIREVALLETTCACTQSRTDGVICIWNNTFFFFFPFLLFATYDGFFMCNSHTFSSVLLYLHLFSSNKHVQIHPFHEWAATRWWRAPPQNKYLLPGKFQKVEPGLPASHNSGPWLSKT